MNNNPINTPELLTGSGTYSSAMSDARNYIDWILKSFGDDIKAPMLEIGVGHGSYAEMLRERGEYIGVDIDRDSVQHARDRFPDSTFHVADITQPEFVDAIGEARVNTVVCLNVLEHIEDHTSAVINLSKVLRRSGRLAVVVPALNMLTNDLDRLAGHLRRYRRSDVKALFQEAGLDPLRVDYFNPIGGVGWLANRLVRHNSLNDPAVNGQIRLFDRWAVPVSRAIDPLTRGFFGQSVIAIGRKP